MSDEPPVYPYLAFYIQKRTKFTWVAIKGGVTPNWNQTIRFNQIQDSKSPGSTTLTVSCVHKKTGVKLGHTDGLIGKCEIDLKQTLFVSDGGVIDGWFQLMHDGKEAGKVQLRMTLCEPSAEEDEDEEKPVRPAAKSHLSLRSRDKKVKKSLATPLKTYPSANTNYNSNIGKAPPSPLEESTSSSSSSNEVHPGSILRSNSQLHRRRSMQDVTERKQTIRFQEPNMRRIGSRSMEEVRDPETALSNSSASSDGDSFQTEVEDDEHRNVSSPKQTFTLQDSEGNINPLNVLIAPFDPNWLEPTPPILRRALTAQYYYDDLHTQMVSNPRELFPRPRSQQALIEFTPETIFLANGQQINTSGSVNGTPQQSQQQQYQQQQQRPMDHGITPSDRPGSHLPTPPMQNWPSNSGTQTQPVPYQPHTVFQPRQRNSKALDMNGTSKHSSLPARYQLPASHMQHFQNIDGTTVGQTSPRGHGGIATTSTATASTTTDQPSKSEYTEPVVTQNPALGPAAGFLPDTYSQEHQRALANQLSQNVPTTMPAHPTLGPDPRTNKGTFMPNGEPPKRPERPERPLSQNTFYPTQPAATAAALSAAATAAMNHPINGSAFFSSPSSQDHNFSGVGQHSQQSSTIGYRHGRTASLDGGPEAFSTMLKSPAVPMPARIPNRAKEAIFAQYTPRSIAWEGRDIQDSINEDVGRRILSRYALGIGRERHVREGFYIKDRSPMIADRQILQQRQQQQQRNTMRGAPQRQLTMELEGNDRVILKYSRSKREWEIDCAMMRYLTCLNPEAKLESQYLDYPQPQQHSQTVNPFVTGLYETFHHTHGTDYEHRFLSVLQWYPETLLDSINDRTSSGTKLEVTLPVVRSLIESVEWIHSRKICHLNIKPTNFVRDAYATSSMSLLRGGGWKLIDFEAARVIGEDIVGRCTFAYASPEILEGHTAAMAVRAHGSLDIWSLGLVIYEYLTDQPLFQSDEHAKDRLLPGGGRNVHQVRYYDPKIVDKAYHPLLDVMLVRDPEKRWSASQILNMDLFKMPISPRPVAQDQMLRNNNIQTLRDLKETRLCNLKGVYMSGGSLSRTNSMSDSGSVVGDQQHQLLEGIGRILDSPFDQVPRLFMLLPPMTHDMEPTQLYSAANLLQNKGMRLVLLCEGLSGYGEDAHVTDHRGYILHDPTSFVQDVGKLLLYLVEVAGTNNPGYETPGLDKPLKSTGTPLDNCQRWYPSLRSYYEILQKAIQRQLGCSAPSLNELRQLRGPTLKSLESWLARLVRKQNQMAQQQGPTMTSTAGLNIRRQPSTVAPSDTMNHPGLSLGGGGYDDLSDHFKEFGLGGVLPPEVPEITGPGGGQGYGGLYKMPVGTCGDRWICRGCVSKQMAMAAEAKASPMRRNAGAGRRGS
ncbi:hypothetical protein BGW39_004816 [Mortierella sp. 14UC]|nr:hypothetical protein BGW39_004816 [Mortierella sp. 14UC]